MDYTALHEVTETIIAIIKQAVDDTKNWPSALSVLPEQLKEAHEGIGFYLFHVQENSHYKNYSAPGNDSPPVNYTPMALNLFYQLSANKRKEDNQDAFDEQRLMSVAMKALHDNAIITKTLSSPINPVGKKINLKITLHTLSPSESVQYWSASQLSMRLSAYYEVSVVFMQPEISTSYAGRVLSYGNYVFVRGTPQIISTENTIRYTLPGDPVVRQVKISPAQAPPADSLPAPADSIVSFMGTGFGDGTTELLLINPRWQEPAVADQVSWHVTLVSENQLDAAIRETALLRDSHKPVNILPGLYAAQVVVTETKTVPGSVAKTFRHLSNQFPFSVMPRIDTIAPPAGLVATSFKVTGYLFQHEDILISDIRVYIGEEALALETGAAVSAGHFKITGAKNIEFKVPLNVVKGLVPIRILIKGVESAPNWITVS